LDFILTLSCADKTGLVRAVSDWLFELDCNILDSDQFRDLASDTFFMRVHFEGEQKLEVLEAAFQPIANENRMSFGIWSKARKQRILVMVSKLDHCLVDLLYRTRNNELPVEIALICSNHRDTYTTAAREDIDFLHLPTEADSRATQEARLLREINEREIDFVVLARYMQILSPEFCHQLSGKIINIHHSFLPSFKGAKPYHQAAERGVKLIGATAHYVTPELDEGPIIEQGVERVDHRRTPAELVAAGRDVERMVLAKAVKYQAEHRILRNGHRTVVFS